METLMLYTDIPDLTYRARSVREFDSTRKIDLETLTRAVDTARLCPCTANIQPLKYRIVFHEEEVRDVLALTKWAGFLTDMTLPPEGKGPSGFIVICHDKTVCEQSKFFSIDVGIAAQTMNLFARERGFGSCMIGSFDANAVADRLLLPRSCDPVLLMAFGTPAEEPIICSIGEDGSTKYFRNKVNMHFVPKRALGDVLLK